MISRQRYQPAVLRKRPVADKVKGKRFHYSEICDKIWESSKGEINSKNDLERAIRLSGIKTLPDKADDKMATAIFMRNKGSDNPKELIRDRGMSYFMFYINEWKDRINFIFDHIRNR